MSGNSRANRLAHALRSVREQGLAEAADAEWVLELCWSCARAFRRRKGRREHYCPKCAAAFAAEASESMEARAGPAYERAVTKSLAYWTGEAERLGLPRAQDRGG